MTEASIAYDYVSTDPGLPNGTSLSENQFTITRRLSAGGFGITYLAQDNTLGRTVVIKECFPDDLCMRDEKRVTVRNPQQLKHFRDIIQMFMREARSLARLRHPNIVGVHRAFEENNTAYMALDLIDGHDLLDVLQSDTLPQLTPDRVKEILLQLLDAVEKVHESDLLHRDISPDNIIIEKSGIPVLIDFGAARGDASRKTRAISSMLVVKDGYSPQEFYLAGSHQTPSSDLYALGATFYHLLTGEAPPNSQVRTVEIAGQNDDPYKPLAGRIEGYEPAFLEAIDLAMEVVPRNRLQSAAVWRKMISDKEQVKTPTAAAITTAAPKPVNQDLDRLLTRLIKETNKEVEQAQPAAVKSEPREVTEVAPPKAPKPEWLDEFNAESRRKEALALVQDSDENAADAAHKSGEALRPHTLRGTTRIISRVRDAQKEDKATNTKRARTRIVYDAPEEPKSADGWNAQAAVDKERALEQQRQALNDQFREPSRGLATRKIVVHAESDFFATDIPKDQLVGPVAKYLITGVVIGLGIILVYPNLL